MQLLERDRCCLYCGIPLDKYGASIDHLIPRAKGGTNDLDNLVLSCKDCNNDKKDMLPLNFILWRLEQDDEEQTREAVLCEA